MTAETTHGAAGSSGGSILTRKTGPLPNWVWMAILLLVALVFSIWRRNKGAANENTDDTADSSISTDLDNQNPPPVFILPQNPQPAVNVTPNVTVNVPAAPKPTTPAPAPPVAVKPAPSKPAPTPKPPAKPATQYATVKVVKYTSKNTAWNSTLWGIANHYGYGAAGNNYTAILNDPKNKALKDKIKGDPKKLPVGATVYVPLRK